MMKSGIRPKTEYGGFLPLELNPGSEYFSVESGCLMRFNSVKASLFYLFEMIGCSHIYIPYYYCPSTTETIKKVVPTVSFYHVSENLEPLDVPDERGIAVLLVDYFGIKNEEMIRWAHKFCHANVILDRAHDFFTEPLLGNNIYNIYSAKKFFGIPDGAYLISNDLLPFVEVETDSYGYADYLILTYEQGTDVAYKRKKEADQKIAENYGGMSKLSRGLLRNVDYKRVRISRESNYKILHGLLGNMNELKLPEMAAAYQYPLLISNIGTIIKKGLVADRIFVSTLWIGSELMQNGNEFELNMAENCIFLPMDQRYNEQDMRYIAEKVRGLIYENS